MYENELIMFSLGLGLSLLIGINYNVLKNFPSSKIFFGAFYILFLAWLFTILEGFIFPDILNLAEHICYAISSVLVAIWSLKVFKKKKGLK